MRSTSYVHKRLRKFSKSKYTSYDFKLKNKKILRLKKKNILCKISIET